MSNEVGQFACSQCGADWIHTHDTNGDPLPAAGVVAHLEETVRQGAGAQRALEKLGRRFVAQSLASLEAQVRSEREEAAWAVECLDAWRIAGKARKVEHFDFVSTEETPRRWFVTALNTDNEPPGRFAHETYRALSPADASIKAARALAAADPTLPQPGSFKSEREELNDAFTTEAIERAERDDERFASGKMLGRKESDAAHSDEHAHLLERAKVAESEAAELTKERDAAETNFAKACRRLVATEKVLELHQECGDHYCEFHSGKEEEFAHECSTCDSIDRLRAAVVELKSFSVPQPPKAESEET